MFSDGMFEIRPMANEQKEFGRSVVRVWEPKWATHQRIMTQTYPSGSVWDADGVQVGWSLPNGMIVPLRQPSYEIF
jgi:hypothetical protein